MSNDMISDVRTVISLSSKLFQCAVNCDRNPSISAVPAAQSTRSGAGGGVVGDVHT